MTRWFDATEPSARKAGVTAAVSAVKRGRLVLVPTESAYAVLADAFSSRAVAAVRTLKGRPDQAPLPVAVSSLSMLRGVADRLTPTGQRLVEAFWPGSLTVVCHQQPSLAWSACGGGRALTVRMPLHPLALEVISGVGPCVLLGAQTPSRPDDRAEGPEDVPGIAVVLTSELLPGPAQPSTVVDVRTEPPVLLRDGALSHDGLLSVAPNLQLREEPA